MSNWLWSFEKLRRICAFKKPDPDILAWAVSRLYWLYPDQAGEVAIKFIDHEDNDMAEEAMDFLKDHCDPRFLDRLFQIYKESSGIVVDRVAGVLAKAGDPRLIDLFAAKYGDSYKEDTEGYSLSLYHLTTMSIGCDRIKEIVKKAMERLAEDTRGNTPGVCKAVFLANLDIGIGFLELLEFCLQHTHLHPAFIDLLIIIGRYCAQEYDKWDLEKPGNGDIENPADGDELPPSIEKMLDILGSIEENGFKRMAKQWKRLFEKEGYEEVVGRIYEQVNRLLEAKKKEHGEENFSQWQKGKGMPRQHIEAITAFHLVCRTAPAPVKLPIAASALYIFMGLLELDLLIGRPIKEIDVDTALEYFLEDRMTVEDDVVVVKILKAVGQEEQVEILAKLLENLRKYPGSYASDRIARYFGATGDPRLIRLLLDVDGSQEKLWNIIIRALLDLGSDALPLVEPILEEPDIESSRIAHVLKVLEEIPTDESLQIILKYWESLWRIDKPALLRSIHMLGDQRLIKPLKKELKEDEYCEGEVFSFICRLNGVRDPLLKKVEQNMRKWERNIKKQLYLLAKEDYRGFFREPVITPLTCGHCGRKYHYYLYDIKLILDTRDSIINDVLVCKHCGTVDHFELDNEIKISLLPHLLAFPQIKDLNAGEMDDFTVVPVYVTPIAGKKMTARETVEYYAGKFREYPTNPEYIIGLANSLRQMKRSEDAEPLYKLALKYDKKALDAYVSLGQMAQHRNDLKEAYNYYAGAYQLLDKGNYYRIYQEKDAFKTAFFESFINVAATLDEPVPLEVVEWLEEMEE